MQQMMFIADLIACSTCFGHHYAHHQELESIKQVFAACGVWCFVAAAAAARKPDTQPSAPHHQELESIKQVFAACGVWCLVAAAAAAARKPDT